jgi:hypothetical protein
VAGVRYPTPRAGWPADRTTAHASQAENDTRRTLEDHLDHPFPSARPPFLGGLELDGYNPALALAFEYNGRQHYQYTPHFHTGGRSDLRSQQARDAQKQELCRAEGIALLTIPYTQRHNLQSHIEAELRGLEACEEREERARMQAADARTRAAQMSLTALS